jgi:hypothetical protein
MSATLYIATGVAHGLGAQSVHEFESANMNTHRAVASYDCDVVC